MRSTATTFVDDDRDRRSEYRQARMAVAGALTVVLGFLLLFDAIDVDYTIQPVTLGVLCTMILVLLGIEGANILRGG